MLTVRDLSVMFFRRLAAMPLRLVVVLLGRLLPLLQSTTVPRAPLLQSTGRTASGRPTAATYMHTMATLAQGQDQTVLTCSARSAEVCGLREFYVRLHPPPCPTGWIASICVRTASAMACSLLRCLASMLPVLAPALPNAGCP